MFFTFLFLFTQAKKRICVCNKKCSLLCPSDSYIATSSNSQFKDYFISMIKDKNEVEIDFYSKEDGFSFELDSTYFGNTKVTLKTLADSRTVKINIKENFQSFDRYIDIKPNFQVTYPEYELIQENINNNAKKNILNDPDETPVPISVPISWMTCTGDVACSTEFQCQKEIDETAKCGQRCWTQVPNDQTFEYTFKGERFGIYGTKDPAHGKFDLYLNNAKLITIDENANTRQGYILLYLSDVLEYNQYTIKAAGIGNVFEIYKFVFWPSMKAKRINSTEMSATQTWTREPDYIGGVGEWTNNVGATKSATIQGSKVWVYGSEAHNHGIMNIQFRNQIVDIDTANPNRVDGKLIWESDEERFNIHRLVITAKEVIYVLCVYYLYDPPAQTSAPDPSRTPIPDSNDRYINNILQTDNFTDQVGITLDSQIKQISGCTFNDISIMSPPRNYLLRFDTQIPFFDNTFKYANLGDNRPMPIWMNFNGKFVIENCKFINCMHRSDNTFDYDGNVFNSNTGARVNVTFDSCEFVNCGNVNDIPIIGIFNTGSAIYLNQCSFTFNTSVSSQIMSAKTQDVSIDNCYFANTGEIRIENGGQQGYFKFTNNIVESNHQSIIYATNMKSAPVINGNSIDECNLDQATYLVTYIHSINEIELINNTFSRNRASSGKQYGGSTALWFQNSLHAETTLTYINCHFINNENAHTEEILNCGGAIQYGYSTSIASTSIIFRYCDFKRNRCTGKGGALSISINQNLAILNCIFEDNTASQGATIYILGQMVKGDDNEPPIEESEMESISIIDCQFIENKGNGDVSGILVEEGIIKVDTINISSCIFSDNGNNNAQILIQASCTNAIFENNDVNYANPTDACGAIRLNLLGSFDLFGCTFTNCNFSGDANIQIQNHQTNSFSTLITNCTFTDCISSKYVIFIQNGGSKINDCTFKFSISDSACSALNIESPDLISIDNCKFVNNSNKVPDEACLYIHRGKEDGVITEIDLKNILFDSCTGSTYSTIFVTGDCENLNTINKLTIQGSQNEQGNAYIYGFNVNKDISFEKCTFSNCRSDNQDGGGSGSKLIPLSEILFYECTWDNNNCSQNGGAFQYGNDATINNKILKFYDCIFTRNKTPEFGGALALQTQNNIFVERCQFNGNIAGRTAQSLNLLADENGQGYGGAVYINPNIPDALSFVPVYSFTDTSFVKNEANDAHTFYIVNSQHMTVSIENQNSFTDNGNTGSAIITDQRLDIGDSVFNTTDPGTTPSNPIQYEKIPAIYDHMLFYQQINISKEQNEGYFYNCTFEDCKFDKSDGVPHQYVINVHCIKFTFDNCTIKFTDSSQACGGISIDCFCNMTIINSYFSQCNVKSDKDQTAGIYYEPIIRTEGSYNEHLILNGNTFDKMVGINARCFKITIDYSKTDLSDNTIKECKDGGHTGAFYLHSNTDTFEFKGWNFLNNECKALLSGGCGLWIAPSKYSTRDSITLTFEGCLWQGNKAIHDPDVNTTNNNGDKREFLYNGLGGGFQFGFSESNAKLGLNFKYCEFNRNSAAYEGGALAIQTTKDCIIQNCIFISNTAGTEAAVTGDKTKSGGAVFIDPDFNNNLVQGQRNPRINIYSCEFSENTAGSDGSALLLRGQAAVFTIDNNTFSNNQGSGSNSVFYSTALSLRFTNSNFTSIDDISTRAIELAAQATLVLEQIAIEGFVLGGIKLSPQSSSSLLLADQKYELNYCTFKRCGSTNNKGGGIYSDNVDKIVVGRSTFDSCKGEGAVAYIGTNVNTFEFEHNTVKNMNDPDNFMIVSGASNFIWDGQGLDKENNNNIKGIEYIGGENIRLQDLVVEGLKKGVVVNGSVIKAEIINCTFLNCPSGNDFVIEIKNNDCKFINNSIVFAENLTTKGRAISITSNGNIEVTYNNFINCCSSDNNKPTIAFSPPELQGQEIPGTATVIFNYNFIQGVGNYKLSLFDINYRNQNINLDHNKIFKCINTKTGPTNVGNENRGDDGYLCQISNIKSNEFTIENLTVEQCQCGSSYGGSLGIWIAAYNNEYGNKKLSFINCNFINNKQTYNLGVKKGKGGGGGFQMNSPASNAAFETLFEGCNFSGNSAATNGGALSIATNKPITIRDCVFNDNKALGEPDGNFLTGCGGAIYLETNEVQNCIIEGCHFENNYDKSGDGCAIYILNNQLESSNSVEIHPTCVFHDNYNPNANALHNYAIYTSSPVFSILGSTISASDVSKQVSGINFKGTNSENNVFNVTFERCHNSADKNNENERALAIDIHHAAEQVTIEFCRFNLCGGLRSNENNFRYTIYDEGKDTTINSCTFEGGQDTMNAPAIKVRSYGTHTITNCYIINPKCEYRGAVSYLSEGYDGTLEGFETIKGDEENENFVFQNITIEGAQGIDRIALDFIIKKDGVVDMNDITIQGCNKSKSCLIGLTIYEASGFNFDNFTFKNNVVTASYGGGTGIWLERRNDNKLFNFTFTNCSFIGNHAELTENPNHQGYGGALQLGGTTQSSTFTYTVTNCIFESNIADRYGGALSIEAENSFRCENCRFVRNEAAEFGGAIYVDPSVSKGNSEITITGCTFEDNDSTGSAIYCKENGNANSRMSITGNCQFKTNTKNDATFIIARCKSLTISDITFDMESLDKTCRAIKIENPATDLIIQYVVFRNCAISSGEGNAIYIDSLPTIQGHQPIQATIENCYFENCGTIGWAVYSLVSQLKYSNNTITYTSNSKDKGGGGLYATGGTIERNTFENTFKYAEEKGNALTVICTQANADLQPFSINHNVFIKCNGEYTRCFNISLTKLVDGSQYLENITIRDCPEASALTGFIEIFEPNCSGIVFEKCKWINNSVSGNVGGGGSGLSLKTPDRFEVYFEDNLFENNIASNGKGGGLQIGSDEDPAILNLYIRGSTFRANEALHGGALALETKNKWIIEGQCIFENNKAKNKGGAIYVNTDLAKDDDYFTGIGSVIRNCSFIHNEATNNGNYGTIIYFTQTKEFDTKPEIEIDGTNVMNNMGEQGYLISSGYKNLVINDLEISGEGIEPQRFGFLYAFSDGETTLNNCKFNRVGSTSGLGNAIRIEETPTIQINSCNFIDCVSNGQRGDRNNFIIYGGGDYGKTLIATNCDFNFTSTNLYSTAICIERYATFMLTGCCFTNCWSNNNNGNARLYTYPGAIRYGPNADRAYEYNDKSDKCRLVIRGCTFENCNHIDGPDQTGGRVIHGYGATNPVLENCTIKDTVDGGYIFRWQYLVDNATELTLKEIRFENNKASCIDGGGSGIYIIKTNKINFDNCYFIKNNQTSAESYGGGGFVCGNSSPEISNREIEFNDCYFEDNIVPNGKNGGSLYICSPQRQTTVYKCTFTDTRNINANGVASLGGAIFITQDQGGVMIEDCTFTHTQSIRDGNAICIDHDTNLVTIKDCVFTDCHHNQRFSVIWSWGNNLTYINNVIEFSDSTKTSRGLIVYKPSRVEIRGSRFNNCIYNEHGCGFALNPICSAETNGIENVIIEDTIFDRCYSAQSVNDKQSAIYLCINHVITFNNVIIQNSNPTSNCNIIIFETPRNVFIEEQKIYDCTFINCSTQYEQDHKGGIGFKHDNIRNLIFELCNFNNLRTTGFGGAVAFHDLRSNADDYSIEFQNCKFDNNSVTGNDGKGASLYFNVSYSVTVSSCNFTFQSLNGYGGAVYAESSSNVFIENSGFYSTVTSGGRGNAIYLARGLPIATIANNNKFVDCGTSKTGSVIESEAKEFVFDSNNIQFTTPNQGVRGIHFPCQCTVKISNSSISGCNSNGEGGGILFNGDTSNQPEFIQIETTVFENNNATNGCALLMRIRALPNITACTIRNHVSGKYIFCIFYQVKLLDEVSLEKCTFEGNYFNIGTGPNDSSDGGGSGIWVAARQYLYDGAYPVGINSCIFRNNRAAKYGGAFAYGNSNTLKKIMVNFRNCEFSGNVAEGERGGAIWINTESECTIDGCSFNNDQVSNSANKFGHAVYADASSRVYITDTTFTNCGSQGLGSVVIFEGQKICMEDNTIQYTQENDGSRGFEAIVATDIQLIRNRFVRCHSTGWGGGVHLRLINVAETDNTVLLFEDLIFDNNTASNGCAALFETSIPPDIHGCTIRNHQSGKYVFCIFFNVLQSYYDLRTCTFESNSYGVTETSRDGGGAGIWIANNKEIAQQRSLQLFFTECQFRDNISPEFGGAFGIGSSDTVKATELVLDSCTFAANTAQESGGALWIATRSNIEIKNCAFRNNRALSNAGSIIIESTAPSCVINKCTFNRENAETKANSICINSLTTETFLTENTFVDCGYTSSSNEVISVNCNSFEYVENTISFTNLLNSCRGLTIESTGTHTIRDSKFSMCNLTTGNKFGGGIYYVCPDAAVNNDDLLEDILIDGCTFDYCHADSGSALYLNPKSIPEITNNVVQNSRTGQYTLTLVLKKGTFTDYTLEGWTFYNNRASPKVINGNTKYDGGGSGIYISNPPSSSNTQFNLTFHKCNWTLNSSPYKGGALAYGDAQELKHVNLIFEECTFVRNNCKKDIAGALWLSSASDASLKINKCTFSTNKALTNTSVGGTIYLDSTYYGRVDIIDTEFSKNSAIEAHALYIESNVQAVNIERCNIISNGNTNSQIVNYCGELNIIDSEVGFGAYTLAARSLSCFAKCRLTVLRSTFANCKTNDVVGGHYTGKTNSGGGGGILYDSIRTTPYEEQIIIEETTFDNCKASNGCALLLKPTKAVIFNKNTIENCRNGKYIFSLFSKSYVERFEFEDCTFRHNKFTNETGFDGGGSGLWIAQANKNIIPAGRHSTLTFTNCQWIENTASSYGGAFACGYSDTVRLTALTFDNCKFIENTANGGQGGALYIQTNKPLLIKDCTFESNVASGSNAHGGSITINSESPSINVVGCTFNSESAKLANAISLDELTNDANITSCTFNDCGKQNNENVIRISSKAVTIDDCCIQFESRFKACRGILINCRCNAVIRDSKFIGPRSDGFGAGIYINTNLQTTNDENIVVEGCLFDRCEGTNGQAIYASAETPIVLRNNLFWHHSSKFVLSIIYKGDVNETFIEDCYFEHNTFNQDGTSGGGSGFWVSREDKKASDITMSGCTWRNNTCTNGDGGGIAFGPTLSFTYSNIEFNDCNFINNTAARQGGALSVQTRAKLSIHNCFFDGNKAGNLYYGGAIYIKKPDGDVTIEDCKFARNSAFGAGAVHCTTTGSTNLNSNIFSENIAIDKAPNLYIIANVTYGRQDIVVSNCKFDFSKAPGEYQIYIGQEVQEEEAKTPEFSVIFIGNCFMHTGDGESVAHIKSDFNGKIQLNEGNCFDLAKEFSIEVLNEQELQSAEGLFDCHTCEVPPIPTSPPTNMPTATPAATPEATTPPPTPSSPPSDYVFPTQTTSQQTATSKPTTATSAPQTSDVIQTSGPTTATTASSGSSGNNSGSSSKSQSKKIVLIAGIAVAAVVIIVVVIILIWLFVCRNRTSIQQEERSRNTEMNEETISGITGVQENNQTDDPIWAGTSGTQDNLLFDGNDNGEADEPANNDFEESWGVM